MNGRNLKLFLPIVTSLFILVSGLVFASSASANNYNQSRQTGSITVCKIVVDFNGNIVDGSALGSAQFTIAGLNPAQTSEAPAVGVIGSTVFNTPLAFGADLIGADQINDAQCQTYNNLSLGSYYYEKESINVAGWAAPKYNDQFTVSVNSLADFFEYDSNLFDGDVSNDAARNQNADGHIVLDDNRPDRTLIVLNQREKEGTPSTTPALGGASAPSCPTDGPQKVDQVWFTDIKLGEVTVHWANKGDAYGYQIAYGPSAGNLPWGVEVGNVSEFTLKSLPAGDLYVKVIAKSSKDCGGPSSDTVKVGGGSGQVLGAKTLASTGVLDNLLITVFGFGLIGLGLLQAQKALSSKEA